MTHLEYNRKVFTEVLPLNRNLNYESESQSVLFNILLPHGLYHPWNSPGQNTEVGGLSLLQGIEPRSPALWADSLPVESQGKPDTGVCSLFLLQRIFPTQESNRGLLHCRQIPYQLSCQGSH